MPWLKYELYCNQQEKSLKIKNKTLYTNVWFCVFSSQSVWFVRTDPLIQLPVSYY